MNLAVRNGFLLVLEAVSKLPLSLRERAGVRANRRQPMHPHPSLSQRERVLKLVLVIECCLCVSARADAPSFLTTDSRLPNPDRPYDMQDGRVEFLQAHDMGLYDLKFQALDANQLDIPMVNREGNWEFDSKYDIAYEAHVSFGLGPVHRVIGRGSGAHPRHRAWRHGAACFRHRGCGA